jgi:hypothetical protein
VVDAEDELEDGEGAPLEDNVYEGIKIEGRLSPFNLPDNAENSQIS